MSQFSNAPALQWKIDRRYLLLTALLGGWLAITQPAAATNSTPPVTEDACAQSDYSNANCQLQCAGDTGTAWNQFGGFYNGPTWPHPSAFAVVDENGQLHSWGKQHGPFEPPTDRYFVSIASNIRAFAALDRNGLIYAWGDPAAGGQGAPTRDGYIAISSTPKAFAALHVDGSIAAWGAANNGGVGAPDGENYRSVTSNGITFAALSNTGQVHTWGSDNFGGTGAPDEENLQSVYATSGAFAALRADGSIVVWGQAEHIAGAPGGSGFQSISTTQGSFAALHQDGSITTWGIARFGASGAPQERGFVSISASSVGFSALKTDGTIHSWGGANQDYSTAPTGGGFRSISANIYDFAALHQDGHIETWGKAGGVKRQGTNYVSITASAFAFAALSADGRVTSWGTGDGALDNPIPADTGFVSIRSNAYSFVAQKADGSLHTWGDKRYGGANAPGGNNFNLVNANCGLSETQRDAALVWQALRTQLIAGGPVSVTVAELNSLDVLYDLHPGRQSAYQNSFATAARMPGYFNDLSNPTVAELQELVNQTNATSTETGEPIDTETSENDVQSQDSSTGNSPQQSAQITVGTGSLGLPFTIFLLSAWLTARPTRHSRHRPG